MLKSIFDIFQVTEAQVTPGAISRLKWAAMLSLPALPLAAAAKHIGWQGPAQAGVTGLAIISVLALFYVCSSRMGNRLWVPEKYLDEAEIARKRKSASLTYQCIHLMAVLFMIWVVLSISSGAGLPMVLRQELSLIYIAGTLVAASISLQTAFAAKDMTGLTENGNVTSSPVDRYYKFVALAVLLCFACFSAWL